MKLSTIMKAVDKAYPEEHTSHFWGPAKPGHPPEVDVVGKRNVKAGDTLAEFVALEIIETFEEDIPSDEQLAEAIRVMVKGSNELGDVAIALGRIEV